MIAPLRLHYAPDNASLVIRLALEELEVSYECCLVDRATQAQKSPDFLRLNPAGLIPVLETDNGSLFETAAILLWLVDRYGRLGPERDDPRRGRFLSWLFFVSNTLHPALRMSFYPWCYIGDGRDDQSRLSAVAADEIVRFFDMLNAEAKDENGAFLRDQPGVLDFYVSACLRWIQLYPPASPHRTRFATTHWPHLHEIASSLEQRQSVAALCRAEGMSISPFTAPDYPDPKAGTAI